MGDEYDVDVDQSICIGCVACTQTCDNFELEQKPTGEFKSKPKKCIVNSDIEAHMLAAQDCPVSCISVKKRN